jgi:hypothetical protein
MRQQGRAGGPPSVTAKGRWLNGYRRNVSTSSAATIASKAVNIE